MFAAFFQRYKWRDVWLETFGAKDVIALSSGRLCLLYILSVIRQKHKEKTQVIISAYTCPSVTEAIKFAGLTVVYCEIEKASGCMSVSHIKTLLCKKTLAVVTGNTFGLLDAIDEIKAAIDEKFSEVTLIEDITWSLGSRYKGDLTGTFGDFSFLSLGLGKIITTSHGGILLINKTTEISGFTTPQLVRTSTTFGVLIRLVLYNIATSPSAYSVIKTIGMEAKDNIEQYFPDNARGEVGLCFETMSKFQSRLSSVLLKELLQFIRDGKYLTKLQFLECQTTFVEQFENIENWKVYAPRYPLVVETKEIRNRTILRLREDGIQASYGFFQSGDYLQREEYPNAVNLSERVLTIPLYRGLDRDYFSRIQKALGTVSLLNSSFN